MNDVMSSIDVNVSIAAAYGQWCRMESFPLFMSGVRSVEYTSEGRTRWVVEVGGVWREFEAEITEQRPEELLAWSTIGGEVLHAGVVSFERLDAFRTRVTVRISWTPDGVVEKTAGVLGLDDLQVRVDLERFKAYVENGCETAETESEQPSTGIAGATVAEPSTAAG